MVVLNNIDKFNGDEITCRSAANFLQEREEMSSETCTDIKAEIGETCCYSTCNLCGEYDLDWDVFVNYNGTDMSCGDFNEIFRTEATIDGSQQCDALKVEYAGTCCYDSPKTSCQLCKQGDTYFDVNDNAQVDFNGPTTCFEVANFMSRRLEDSAEKFISSEEKLLAHVILSSSTLTMFEKRQFPADYMLGWLADTKPWPIADIIAHSEFDKRMDMIIEQVRANGFFFGIETETFGNYLCELYQLNKLPSDVIARLRENNFSFSEKGE